MGHVASECLLYSVSCKRACRTSASLGTGCYWGGDGKHQALYDTLIEKHMPVRGAPTTGGTPAMLVYALHKLQHEWWNNGFLNVELDPNHVPRARTEFSWDYVEMLEFLYSVAPAAGDIVARCASDARARALESWGDEESSSSSGDSSP